MRDSDREAHPVTCLQCGYVTKVSFQRRRDEPRLCRRCGAVIAQPKEEAQP